METGKEASHLLDKTACFLVFFNKNGYTHRESFLDNNGD